MIEIKQKIVQAKAKPIVLACALFGWVFSLNPVVVSAQQLPLLHHYYLNPYLINPATVGEDAETKAFLHYRQQWVGIAEAPQTQVFTLQGALDERLGLGIHVSNDATYLINRTTALLSSSYKIPFSTDHYLAFGMSLGLLNVKLDFDRIRADLTDPGLLANGENRSTMEGNAGLSYRYKRWHLGIASEQLLGRSLSYTNANDNRSITYKLVRHYVVSAAADVKLQPNWTLRPQLLIRNAQGLPAQIDINAMFTYKAFMWTALNYRHESGVALSVGWDIRNKILLSYSFEQPTTDIRHVVGGSHEVCLGIRLKKQQPLPVERANRKATEGWKSYADAQYEKLDELQQQNEALNQSLENYKKVVDQQNDQIEKLKKELKSTDSELKILIEQIKVDVQREESFDVAFNYYLVIGATKSLEDARLFERNIKRETRLKPEIIQNENQTWYFIYSDVLKSPAEAQRKLTELNDEDIRKKIIGNPWVYKSKKSK
jgi:type IX secretion system PorP/SprF family membrane protein